MDRLIYLVVVIVAVSLYLAGVSGIQCYHCSGMTNYDPDGCFRPKDEDAIFQECSKGDSCEKTIHHIDRWQQVVSRGCSSNCNGRTYIYTDDFQTHCCKEKSRCNSAPPAVFSLSCTVLMTLCAFLLKTLCL